MQKYNSPIITAVKRLRNEGKTYGEINQALKQNIPKSTLYEWCKDVKLPVDYPSKITSLNLTILEKARLVALQVNKKRREEMLNQIKSVGLAVSLGVKDQKAAKIALAMLCLGEASKYKKSSVFSLGSSDPRIIVIFLELLKRCYPFNLEKIRCTVQCRADQNILQLENYWRGITKIPPRLFYKSRIDPRTIGKPTKNQNYKGVLKVDYFDTRVQLELEAIAELVYNQLSTTGPEV